MIVISFSVMYGRVDVVHEAAAIVACGPSLRGFDFSLLNGLTVIAVNRAVEYCQPAYWFTLDPSRKNYQLMRHPKAGVRYFCAVPEGYSARKTRDPRLGTLAHVTYLRRIQSRRRLGLMYGLSEDSGAIHTGNSAYGALGLAYLMGAKRIALLGVDGTREGYFYRDSRPGDLSHLPSLFASAVQQLAGSHVVNGSPESRIDCFPRMSPERAIEHLRKP